MLVIAGSPPPPPPRPPRIVYGIVASSMVSLSLYQASKENTISPYISRDDHVISMIKRASNFN